MLHCEISIWTPYPFHIFQYLYFLFRTLAEGRKSVGVVMDGVAGLHK